MRNELEGFENRENDWLAKEIRREAKLSPWNVDEAKIIKEEHARVHERQNTINQAHREMLKREMLKQRNTKVSKTEQTILIYVCFLIIFIIFTMMVFIIL